MTQPHRPPVAFVAYMRCFDSDFRYFCERRQHMYGELDQCISVQCRARITVPLWLLPVIRHMFDYTVFSRAKENKVNSKIWYKYNLIFKGAFSDAFCRFWMVLYNTEKKVLSTPRTPFCLAKLDTQLIENKINKDKLLLLFYGQYNMCLIHCQYCGIGGIKDDYFLQKINQKQIKNVELC